MYFLIASGLSLIYGLMGVLNFAHGAFLTVGAYATWWMREQARRRSARSGCASWSARLDRARRRRGRRRARRARADPPALPAPHRAGARDRRASRSRSIALVQAIWGPTERIYPAPTWLYETTTVLGAQIPNDRFVEIAAAVAVLARAARFLRYTRYGLIIRAGVENRAMVTALGIDVRKAFTLVFAIGGVAAALAGVLAGVYFGPIDPHQGTSLLIFAFIVVVIGGLGSIAARRSPPSSSGCSSST